MTLKKRVLLVLMSSIVVFLAFINTQVTMRSTRAFHIKGMSGQVEYTVGVDPVIQLQTSVTHKSEKTEYRKDSEKTKHISKVNSFIPKETEMLATKSTSHQVSIEAKVNDPIRNTLNLLENKTFELARSYIKGLINSITENQIIHNAPDSIKSVTVPTTMTPGVSTSEAPAAKDDRKTGAQASTLRSREEEATWMTGERKSEDTEKATASTHNLDKHTEENPWLLTHELPSVGRLRAPVLKVPPETRVLHNKTWHGHTMPVLTFRTLGRLGNVMAAYASVWAASRIYNTLAFILHVLEQTTVFMAQEAEDVLRPVFPNLTMSPLPVRFVGGSWLHVSRGSNNVTDYTPLQEAAAGLRGARTIRIDGFPTEMQLFNAFREDVVREFTFSLRVQQQAQEYLHGVASLHGFTSFVGVHIRSTDFAAALQTLFHLTSPGKDYLKRALTFYRQRLPRVVFIVASEDVDYATQMLEEETDVVYAPGSPLELDLAVLTACNHTVVTIGSFGFWAGYMAGGTVIYPDLQSHSGDYSFSRAYYQRANLTQFISLPP